MADYYNAYEDGHEDGVEEGYAKGYKEGYAAGGGGAPAPSPEPAPHYPLALTGDLGWASDTPGAFDARGMLTAVDLPNLEGGAAMKKAFSEHPALAYVNLPKCTEVASGMFSGAFVNSSGFAGMPPTLNMPDCQSIHAAAFAGTQAYEGAPVTCTEGTFSKCTRVEKNSFDEDSSLAGMSFDAVRAGRIEVSAMDGADPGFEPYQLPCLCFAGLTSAAKTFFSNMGDLFPGATDVAGFSGGVILEVKTVPVGEIEGAAFSSGGGWYPITAPIEEEPGMSYAGSASSRRARLDIGLPNVTLHDLSGTETLLRLADASGSDGSSPLRNISLGAYLGLAAGSTITCSDGVYTVPGDEEPGDEEPGE